MAAASLGGNPPDLRPRGGVVTQRTANPRTPVQFRAWPPMTIVVLLTKVAPDNVLIGLPPERETSRAAHAKALLSGRRFC